jgi:hypothetical protein
VGTEYDPLFSAARPRAGDLAPVRELFRDASAPYLRSPWSWLCWALVLPAAAAATPRILGAGGPAGVLYLWAGAILAGGAIELLVVRRGRRAHGEPAGASPRRGAASDLAAPVARWAFRAQGNLSLVALILSALLLWQDLAWALPGLWLLLLGHSFYILGGLAFPPLRAYGLIYQVGGVAALWPGGAPLAVFALAAAAGNGWMAWSVWRATRAQASRAGVL